jgi:hypothetical protein
MLKLAIRNNVYVYVNEWYVYFILVLVQYNLSIQQIHLNTFALTSLYNNLDFFNSPLFPAKYIIVWGEEGVPGFFTLVES